MFLVVGTLLALQLRGFIACSIDDTKISITNTQTVNIGVSLNNQNSQSLDLEDSDTSLDLLATATNLQVSVSGCTSGYTFPVFTITSGAVKLYKGDKGCLVKLQSFQLGSTTYSATATGANNFTTWLANGVATFANTTQSTDLISVFVNQQVTQSGILSSDSVIYNFTNVQTGTSDTVGPLSVKAGVPLTVQGEASPNFTITQARFLSINTNGSANISFTLQCGAALTGSSGAYSCSSVPLTQFDYIFIPDAYSQGTLTVAQANTAFSANSPTAVASASEVSPGGTDLNGNTLTNGGFYTSNASPLNTGTTPIYPNGLNNVLMIRMKDLSGNTMSYLYFYVDFSPLNGSVSGCNAIFAGGAGTVSNPYQINDRFTLVNTANCTSSSIYFIQTNNIDLGGSGSPWTPIQLYGQYNGSGNSITGLNITGGTANNIALFSIMNSGASVSNLTITSLTVSGGQIIGGLAGQMANGTVTNCSSSGTITANAISTGSGIKAGGLIGIVYGGTVTSSFSSVNMTTNPSTASGSNNISFGGLVGHLISNNSAISVTNSYATGTVNSSSGSSISNMYAAGGLVGRVENGGGTVSISNSYATGNQTHAVTGSTNCDFAVGGLIGLMENGGSLSGSFSKGSISFTGSPTTYSFVGGLVGYALGPGVSIANSYSMGSISISATSGAGATGGFIGGGHYPYPISTCYSAESSLSSSGTQYNGGFIGHDYGNGSFTHDYLYANGNVPSDSTSGVTSYTTATQMQTQSNYIGFTFGTGAQNWKMPSANPLSPSGLLSPVLYWQCGSNGIVCP